MVSKVDLSIIVLNYNTSLLLERCLSSIEKSEKNSFTYETIVVDNASKDGSPEMVKKKFPWVKLIENPGNYGFTKGNNVGLKEAKGRYFLLLNSDTEVLPETFLKMIKFMDENKDVGLSTCRVELADGRLDPACHRGFPTPWASLTYMAGLEKLFPKSKIFGQYHQTFKDLNKPHQIDAPTGAFSLVRREATEQVGHLDESYFMYGEDLDWAYRIKKSGWQIWYYPETKVTHFKKQSGRSKEYMQEEKEEIKKIRKMTTKHFYDTMKTFYRKHYADKYPWIVNTLVFLGIEVKRKLSLLRL